MRLAEETFKAKSKCRFCNNELKNEFIDLVNAPPSNSYLTKEQLNEPEIYFPLKVFVCEKCWLVQVDEYKKSSEIFDKNYAYFSSYSSSWLKHSENYVDMISDRLKLDKKSLVIEVASNDGYLLQYFLPKRIPCIGIEPAANTAKVAEKKGIHTIEDFFSVKLAKQLANEGKTADLILGNNVLAHTPDINDFVEGLRIALKPEGTITMEFPHLLNLIKFNQFDTIYHEHFSYLSLLAVGKIFEAHYLVIYDVEELPTHGGSLRIYARHKSNTELKISSSVSNVLKKENDFGLNNLDIYLCFQKKTDQIKYAFLEFLIQQKKSGKKVAAYGAAAKGNTLLNYCGIKNDMIKFVVDKSPHKQNKYLPGSHIPIVSEDMLKTERPDYTIILPWNIKDEIIEQLRYIRSWDGHFVVAIPKVEIF
ncbi:MAG: class I SAM-dependent methyltransferase [Sedimentisphaerales bacterium]|jgi:SAM-dependent methyltransferase